MSFWPEPVATTPPTVTLRTVRHAVEEHLIGAFTRSELETVLADELVLNWSDENGTLPSSKDITKREVIQGYTRDHTLDALLSLARRLVKDYGDNANRLQPLLDVAGAPGGVESPVKNLIFASSGPKPELVLRDALNNDVEIVKNAEHCLIYTDPIPADGLTYRQLTKWWRTTAQLPDSTTEVEAARSLWSRLRASLGDNQVEQLVFDRYTERYRDDMDIPALIPQVYLHFDPLTLKQRQLLGAPRSPLARQRMDFLILFSERRRVVIEVDGKQHYSDASGKAVPRLYSEMVAEDRRLRLEGYEVYRFGGYELGLPDAADMLDKFFDNLAGKTH